MSNLFKFGKCRLLLVTVIFTFLLFSSCGTADLPQENDEVSQFWVGSYVDGGNKGIHRLTVDQSSDALTIAKSSTTETNPSYLTWNTSSRLLYAVNEKKSGGITVFSWDDGMDLSLVRVLDGIADSPCHISISPSGKHLAIANYMSGDIHVFNIVGNNITLYGSAKHKGSGPHPRQEAPHAHWVDWSPDGKFVYAVDLGLDQVMVYQMGKDTLLEGKVAITLNPADGPRHMVFHGQKNLAYVINELSNIVSVLRQDENSGELIEIQRISSLSESFKEHSQAAAIKLSPDNRFLYVSNRGANSLAVFKLGDEGRLTFIQEQSTSGDWPRDFSLSANGKFILVANQRSNTITLLKRDTKTGLLEASSRSIDVSKPTFIDVF